MAKDWFIAVDYNTAQTNTIIKAAPTCEGESLYISEILISNGATIRGVIGLYHATSTEFPLMASAATRIHSARVNGATAFSSQAGDRIIIEIGLHGVTPAAELTQMRIGDPSGTADFALTAALTTDLCPWVQLSRDVTFGAAQTFYQTLPATGVSVLSLLTSLILTRVLSAIGIAVAGISRIVTYARNLSVTGVSVLTISLAKSFYRTLSVTGIGVVSLTKSLYKVLSVTGTSVISLATAKLFTQSIVVTGTSIPTISMVKTFRRLLSVTGIVELDWWGEKSGTSTGKLTVKSKFWGE